MMFKQEIIQVILFGRQWTNMKSKRRIANLTKILLLIFGGLGLYLFILYKSFSPIDKTYLNNVNSEDGFSILVANIGNSNLYCKQYFWKICLDKVEENIIRNVEILNPDVIVFQEVLAPWACEENPSKYSFIICAFPQDIPLIRRLLGSDYYISCDSHRNMQCIGVNIAYGEIVGCSIDEICISERTKVPPSECNQNFVIFAVTVKSKYASNFDIVNVHLTSRGDVCRQSMLSKILNDNLLLEDHYLVAGDFNVDIWRDDNLTTKYWKDSFTADAKSYGLLLHYPLAEEELPEYTFILGSYRKTLDYMMSNFLESEVSLLSNDSNLNRLDGGWGMDHFAIYGIMKYSNP